MQNDSIIYMQPNHADEQPKTVGQILGNAGLKFLGDIVNAKEQGAELPGFLNKIATIAMSTQDKAIQIAKEETKKEATNKLGWIIAAVLVGFIVILLIKR